MPELPEVEVCRRGLLPQLSGRRMRQVVVRTPRLRHDIPADLPALLAGCRVADLQRRGKYLLFACDNPDRGNEISGEPHGWLIIHLGMTGNLQFVNADQPPGKHDHVDFVLDDGQCLRFSDPRRFGVILWHAGATCHHHPLLANQGIEPLTPDFTGEWLHAATRQRSGPIKPVLMDSHLVVGIGNIYAAESLFRAGISPLRAANRISLARYRELVLAAQETLTAAIAAGGSSIRDYVHNDGSSGWFQIECAVYDRAGQACRRCGQLIRQIRQAGRSTFYCAHCQT